MLPELSEEETIRYTRHLVLPEIGMDGQRKLKAASVLVVGVGGLGSVISMYMSAAGIGRIGLVDHDIVDATNMQRQVIYDTADIGRYKVESARRRLLCMNPNARVDMYCEEFSFQNAERIAGEYTLIMDGTDNFPSRDFINNYCVSTGKTYVYGACFQFEGQVSVFDARQGPCLRCIFPELPPSEPVSSGVGSGLFGVLPGAVGAIQVSEALKRIIGIGTPMMGRLLLINILEMNFHVVNLQKNPACITCGESRE